MAKKIPTEAETKSVAADYGSRNDGALSRAVETGKGGSVLLANTDYYRSLFENMLNGFAYCEMLYDSKGEPVDFVYLETNNAFEKLTGLKNVVGKKVTEVIPGIKELNPELFEIYGRVASTGKPDVFEVKIKSMKIWLSISVYSPKKNHFVALFDNITAQKDNMAYLQKMNEVMTDRELKMVDLKTAAKRLQKLLEEKDAEINNLKQEIENLKKSG